MRIPGIPYVQGRNRYSDADGTKYGIAIHNTSNPTADAGDEASYATRRTDGISAHFYVDRTRVIQSLDTNARAGHAGSSEGNQNAIAVEICGTNDRSRAWWLTNVDWTELGRVLAVCCRTYGIAVRRASVAEMKSNPKVKAFYGHDDMRRAWGGTTHTDPGGNFPWDRLFAAVNAALNSTLEEDMALDTADKNFIIATVNSKTWGYPVSPEASMLTKMVALFQKVDILAAAAVDDDADREAIKVKLAEIDEAVASARTEVAGVDEQVWAKVHDPAVSDEEAAAFLREALAARPGVLALLAAG